MLPVYAKWAADAPDHVTTSFRIMQLPPLPEIPEPIRGRSIVMIDGAVQGDPAVLEPLRALAPGDRHVRDGPRAGARPPAPGPRGADALRRRHRADRRAAARRRSRRCCRSPARRAARRWRSSSCASSAARCARRAPGHGAVGGIDAQFVLFLCGMALDADMGAFMQRPRRARQGRAGAVERRAATTSTSPRTRSTPSLTLRRRHVGAAEGGQGARGPGRT